MTSQASTAANAQHGFKALPASISPPTQPQNGTAVPLAPGLADHSITRLHPPDFNRDTTPSQPKPFEDRFCNQSSSDGTPMDFHTLKAYLIPEAAHQPGITPSNLAVTRYASMDPPVTKASLSELDLVRIINDSKLRHDLNFEREISFRPNVSGPRSDHKESSARVYWEALVIEFALYMELRRNSSASNSKQSCQKVPSTMLDSQRIQQSLLRLPRMFITIRDILKTLVPGTECAGVDLRLDVDLLMQELEKGACDVKGLSNWLSKVLLGSCSPLRDKDVGNMVDAIRQGVDMEDPRRLVDGLKILFGILEMMKLDVANHQIRYLRLLLVDDSIHFEQTNSLRQIADGWDVEGARGWFDDQCTVAAGQERFTSFIKAVVTMVVDSTPVFPPTFGHDIGRLLHLQSDFAVEVYQEACSQAFTYTLHRLGWHGTPPYAASSRMLCHVLDLLKDSTCRNARLDFEAVALEVVQQAYNLCRNTALPHEYLVNSAQLHLLETTNLNTTTSQDVRTALGRDLADLVHCEVANLINLSPLQMLDYLSPGSCGTESTAGAYGMVNIAKRTAHIAVLHWKTWAPILYEQPRPTDATLSNRLKSVDIISPGGTAAQCRPVKPVEAGPRQGISRSSSTSSELAQLGLRSGDARSSQDSLGQSPSAAA